VVERAILKEEKSIYLHQLGNPLTEWMNTYVV
jgi:hypothetical protein